MWLLKVIKGYNARVIFSVKTENAYTQIKELLFYAHMKASVEKILNSATLIQTIQEHNDQCRELVGKDYALITVRRYESCKRYRCPVRSRAYIP